MLIRPTLTRAARALAAVTAFIGGAAWGAPIMYQDYMDYQSIVIGGTAYQCTSLADATCATIIITGYRRPRSVEP